MRAKSDSEKVASLNRSANFFWILTVVCAIAIVFSGFAGLTNLLMNNSTVREQAEDDFKLMGAMAAVLVVTQWLARRASRERRSIERSHGGLCATCGYDLTGNISGICPECGQKIQS